MATHGVVIGRFNPPHNGHRYLIDFASGCVDRLSVLVGTLSSDAIDGELRYRWMRELFPAANIIHITEENPKAKKGSPDSYRIWARGITESAGEDIDFVFASEEYGFPLARELGARYVPVDPARTVFPVSATMVRRNPMGSWPFIPDRVRPFFVRRIYILSEEAGEADALLEHLADHFHTVSVGDYVAYHAGRTSAGELTADFAVRAQRAAEDALARQADRLLFSASDPVHAWTRAVGMNKAAAGAPPPTGNDLLPQPALNEWACTRYLINPPMGESKASIHNHRAFPVLAQTLEVLAAQGADIRVLSGSAGERFHQAVDVADEVLRA